MDLDDKLLPYANEVVKYSQGNEKRYIALGKLCAEIENTYGNKALNYLVKLIRETHGVNVSFKTLLDYSRVERTLGKFDIPKDMNYTARQMITAQDDSEYWVNRFKNEGLSSAQLILLIKEKTHNRRVCKECGRVIYTKKKNGKKKAIKKKATNKK